MDSHHTSEAPTWLVEATSLVGREPALAELRGYLDEGARLVTILGAPGLGKTRVMRRLGKLLREDLSVWFCDLTPARGADDVVRIVARALGVPLAGGAADADPGAALGRAIAAAGSAVLLLDNAEHVVEHVPATVGRWLAAAPAAQFVVTSRQTLGLEEEVRFELSPLTPVEGSALFTDRLRQVQSGRAPAPRDPEVIAEIVRRLDGIPLAIELAAARGAVLSPAQILERIEARFELLRTSRRDAVPRHATLERAIDWSWDGLSPREQSALAQLAVFRGGFSLEAAEAVVDLAAFPEAPSVMDALQALREKSLVRHELRREPPGGARFDLFESIRAYVDRKLGGAARAEAEARHARFHVERAERWAAEAAGPGGATAIGLLGLEFDNLAAIGARHGADAELACRAVLALDALLFRRGPYTTRLAVLEDAAPALERAPADLEIRFRCALADARMVRGRYAEAVRELERALDLARASGDASVEAGILATLGDMAFDANHFDVAHDRFQEARDAARRCGDRSIFAAATLGDPQGWESIGLDEALALVAEAGDLRRRARALFYLGFRCNFWGDPTVTLEMYERANELARQVGDAVLEATTRLACASALHVLERFDEAAAIYEESVRAQREAGNGKFLGFGLALYGALRLAEWRLGEARALLEEGLRVSAASWEGWGETMSLACLGALEAASGRLAPAEDYMARARARATLIDAHGVSIRHGVLPEMLGGVVDLARARRDDARGHEVEASRRRASVADRLAALPSLHRGGTSFMARIAGLVLARAVQEDRPAGPAEVAAPPPDRPPPSARADALPAELEIGPEGAWFRLRGGEPVVLRSHAAMRRLLAALAARRLARPGDAVSPEDLVRAGWPDERIRAKAAQNRLHNAVALLRGRGLRGILRTTDEGYLLDPRVPVIVAPDSQR